MSKNDGGSAMTTQDKLADALRILRAKPSGYSPPEFEALELLHDALAEHDSTSAAPDAPAPKGAGITDAAEWVAAHCDDPDIEATIHRALALAKPPAPGEADEFDKPAMKLTALRKKLAAAEDAAKSAGEACDDYERMYQESRATLIRGAIAALRQPVPDDVKRDSDRWRALLSCARIRIMGWAGFNDDSPSRASAQNYRHFEAGFWTQHDAGNQPSNATETLIAFADAAIAQQNSRNGSEGEGG